MLAQFRDHEPAPGAEFQQPPLLQALQRLAHRRTADPEIARNLLLTHALADGDAAVRNRVTQALEHEVGTRARAERLRIDRGQRARRRCCGHVCPPGTTGSSRPKPPGSDSIYKCIQANTIGFGPIPTQ